MHASVQPSTILRTIKQGVVAGEGVQRVESSIQQSVTSQSLVVPCDEVWTLHLFSTRENQSINIHGDLPYFIRSRRRR